MISLLSLNLVVAQPMLYICRVVQYWQMHTQASHVIKIVYYHNNKPLSLQDMALKRTPQPAQEQHQLQQLHQHVLQMYQSSRNDVQYTVRSSTHIREYPSCFLLQCPAYH